MAKHGVGVSTALGAAAETPIDDEIRTILAPEVLNPFAVARSRVLLIHTGGTIGMVKLPNGSLGTRPGALSQRLRHLDELQADDTEFPQCWLEEMDPLIDSADICPEDWIKFAECIDRHYFEYDGFVIIHGTDTMAYTASALSFMLENLAKPVVLTGSQLPIFEPTSDARRNLVSSIMLAGSAARLDEVVIFFDDKVLRGNRSMKVDATGLSAFTSPNFPPLATLGVTVKFRADLFQPPPRGRFHAHKAFDSEILVIRLVPGFSDGIFDHLGSVKGLVLLLYGCGNAPARRDAFLKKIEDTTKAGVVVVAVSQCLRGTVRLGAYAVGKELEDRGVVSAGDMTTEAACAKLAYLFSKGLSPKRIRLLMSKNLRGEMSEDDATSNNSTDTASRWSTVRSLL
eukprot:TRINITY_DN12317_c0_g1_i5.p1 TRINITY_DN12317_c0_g1~~TRINITY_DN12317_c0_g1_i5.p1  ORF type:complete len:399 (+),score=53.36 TRINITY_DN12317_c0_g1_i5:147-1343(+)